MQENIIKKSLSSKVLMAGNYYKHHHPGGISAVVDYWSRYIENLQYYPTFKESNQLVKRGLFFVSYMRMFFRMLFDQNIKIVHLHTAADGSFWRKVQLQKLAKKMNKPVYGITGLLGSGYEECLKEGFERIVPLIVPTMDTEEAIKSAEDTAAMLFEDL